MCTEDELNERLLRWREQRAQGKNVSAEELCADRPELADALADLIRRWMALPPSLQGRCNPAHPPATGPLMDQLYEIVEKLGEGAMGIVYKARERETGRLVALKVMKQRDAAALDRMRKEVRALQDVSHPNLVTLYDVRSDGDLWFFTMELVEGRPFPGHLALLPDNGPAPSTIDALSALDECVAVAGNNDPPPMREPTVDVARLRRAFIDLANAIDTLHQRDRLHRDIKPTNVLVTLEGRVVVLDFGLVTPDPINDGTFTVQRAGTLLYMPPEQWDGRAEKSSDWYSFGVMLYESLTCRHPFRDTPHQMPWERQGYVPPSPRSLAPGIPADLGSLCDELLHANPAERPSGSEVRSRLEGRDRQGSRIEVDTHQPPFIGRQQDLSALKSAFADSRREERPVVVCVHGQSGMGKSSLVEKFLEQLGRHDGNVVVLRGRCYQRESIPFKALDALVHSLSRRWRRLPREVAGELLPQDVGPLVQAFPVLERVEAVAGAPRKIKASADPHEQRRRAVRALREVFARIGTRWPLVVYLDDLQWGDVDSAQMLTEVLVSPDAPSMLVIACVRSEDQPTSPFMQHFLPLTGETGVDRRELRLAALTEAEARDLAVDLLHDAGKPDNAADVIARESAGSPFFIHLLARAPGVETPVIHEAIWHWICSLERDQRQLLDMIAVAGRPLRSGTAFEAAQLRDNGRKALIALQAARVVRLGDGPSNPFVETYHDRIRETVVGHLTGEALATCHRRLAVALVASGELDLAMIGEHFQHGGEQARAAINYQEAADEAVKGLAFDRAAKLYRLALDNGAFENAEVRRLRKLLGDALANAGRGEEAARAYLNAAERAPAEEMLGLRRLAGEQYMRCGRLTDGMNILRTVLDQIGIVLPETDRQRRWSLLWTNFRMWWRGTRFRKREVSEIAAADLARVDLCWSIGSALALADAVAGSALHRSHFYALALDTGEPNRVALALGVRATVEAMAGGARQRHCQRFLDQANELAERTGVPYTLAMLKNITSACAVLLGQWKTAGAAAEQAEQQFRRECTGVAWEIGITCHYRFACWFMCGEWKRCAEELPPLLKEARERGDLYTATSLQIHSAHLAIAADDPKRARETIAEALQNWPQRGFQLQHYHALGREVEAVLYAGHADEAWSIVNRHWQALCASQLPRLQEIRIMTTYLRAGSALAAALASKPGAARTTLLRSAERDAPVAARADAIREWVGQPDSCRHRD